MPSIPPSGAGGWRNPYEGWPLVRIVPGERGRYDVLVQPGASVHDLVGATATLPNVVYLDHRPVQPGGAAVRLRFRSLPNGVPAGGASGPDLYDAPTVGGAGGSGGWVPSGAAPGTGAITPYQEALYLLLAAGPDGPTGARLRRCLLGCDPRSVVALADMVRQPACR